MWEWDNIPKISKYYQTAKAAFNPLTYAEVCRPRAQSGLETRVVYAVNDEYWVLEYQTLVPKLTR